MISSNNGTVIIKGTDTIVMADLTMALKIMLERGILDTDDINECLELAQLSNDELHKKWVNVITGHE